MATIIEVTESKLECLSECAEKMLRYGGKLMSAIEELYGSKYGMKKHRDEDEEDYEKRYGSKHRMYRDYPRYY